MKHSNAVALDGQLMLFDIPAPDPDRTIPVLRRRAPTPRPRPRANTVLEQLALFEQLFEMSEEEIEREAWTADDVTSLREFMLWRHVHYIMDKRTSDETLRETWEWILDEEVAPFSFRVCLDSVLNQTGHTLAGDERVVTIDRDAIREQIYGYAQYYGTWHAFSLLTHRP